MIEIFTDGACSGNPGPGGWAVKVFLTGESDPVKLSGYEPSTTNNRMELRAAIEGLKHLGDARQKVKLYSDSAYLVNCFQQGWYKKWQRNGWQTQKGLVLNQDLWQALIGLTEQHDVQFCKVKGHSTNTHNNDCDQMAVAEIVKNRVT